MLYIINITVQETANAEVTSVLSHKENPLDIKSEDQKSNHEICKVMIKSETFLEDEIDQEMVKFYS